MDGPMRLPTARSEGLVIEELGEELLVYDLDVKDAHCLTAVAARVWSRCDGRTPPEGIARQLGVDIDEVVQALNELERCVLLAPSPVVADSRLSRRDLGLKVTKVAVGVATVPLILSVAAPASAASASLIALCAAIDVSTGCGNCNDGGTAGGPCCCCQPGGGSKKTCAAGQQDCTDRFQGMCTEK